jgi:hypothetical protein
LLWPLISPPLVLSTKNREIHVASLIEPHKLKNEEIGAMKQSESRQSVFDTEVQWKRPPLPKFTISLPNLETTHIINLKAVLVSKRSNCRLSSP